MQRQVCVGILEDTVSARQTYILGGKRYIAIFYVETTRSSDLQLSDVYLKLKY